MNMYDKCFSANVTPLSLLSVRIVFGVVSIGVRFFITLSNVLRLLNRIRQHVCFGVVPANTACRIIRHRRVVAVIILFSLSDHCCVVPSAESARMQANCVEHKLCVPLRRFGIQVLGQVHLFVVPNRIGYFPSIRCEALEDDDKLFRQCPKVFLR